jgi:hypothetical protein
MVSAPRSKKTLPLFAALLAASHLAAGNDLPQPTEEDPPAAVRRAGEKRAQLQDPIIDQQHKENPDVHAIAPELTSSQRTVNYRKPHEPAWLLVFKIGDVGPRALTALSEEKAWLEKRDALPDQSTKNDFVADRIRELIDRAQNPP